MTRAIVIKRYGDPALSGAIVDGMTKALSPAQMEVVKAEIDRQHIVRKLVRVAVGNTKTAQDYACMTAKAKGNYGYIRHHGRLYGAVLGAWALLWLIIYDWVDYFSAWNREA